MSRNGTTGLGRPFWMTPPTMGSRHFNGKRFVDGDVVSSRTAVQRYVGHSLIENYSRFVKQTGQLNLSFVWNVERGKIFAKRE